MFSRQDIKAHADKFGIQLKDVQLHSIENVLAKRDTLVIAKTGEGKSLIFQVASSLFNSTHAGIVVIVCPLVSLMMDQTRAATVWGSAVFLGSSQPDKQAECHLESYRFIFMAPEKFQQASIQRELQRISKMIFLIVVDEAHTLVTWQGFRPAFSEIPAVLKNIFGDERPTLLMMTATLPKAQQELLSQSFQLSKDAQVFRVSCDRENLSIQIVNTVEKISQLLQYARSSQAKRNLCLIYVATPMECQSLGNSLKQADESSLSVSGSPLRIRLYHGAGSGASKVAGNDAEYRAETLRLATSKDLDVCVCTSAFALGIDIPNIDTVIHAGLPKSLSEYAQQIGRAGRDGNQAIAVMMFHPGKISQCFSLWVADKNPAVMKQNFSEFQSMMSFVYSSQCRRKFVRQMLEDVDASVELASPCNCDTCEESHIIRRDIAPAMRLLLMAIKEHAWPVCITRVSDTLFAHAPKHKGQWDDSKSPLWGKGKALFAPTKQNDIWSSLAAVAIYELKFLVASLHSHQAMGNIVAYQRLAVTEAGMEFLASNSQKLLVGERFVAPAAWKSIDARCTLHGCTNKGVRYVGTDFMCSKHAIEASSTPGQSGITLNTVANKASQSTRQPPSSQAIVMQSPSYRDTCATDNPIDGVSSTSGRNETDTAAPFTSQPTEDTGKSSNRANARLQDFAHKNKQVLHPNSPVNLLASHRARVSITAVHLEKQARSLLI
jgi:ATP-dependent DNA helicase RecQ